MNIAREMVRRMVAEGWTVIVEDPGSDSYDAFTSFQKAWELINGVDMAEVWFVRGDRQAPHNRQFLLVIPENGPEDNPADFSNEGRLDEIFKELTEGEA